MNGKGKYEVTSEDWGNAHRARAQKERQSAEAFRPAALVALSLTLTHWLMESKARKAETTARHAAPRSHEGRTGKATCCQKDKGKGREFIPRCRLIPQQMN